MESGMLFGDCRRHLAELEAESIDLVVTDPPYNTGLRAGASRLHHFFDDAMDAGEYRALAAAGFRLKNCVVWDKVLHGLNYQNYAYTHEFLIFAVKGRFFPKNRGTGDDSFKDVWRVSRVARQESAAVPHHETVKPLEVIRRPIEHASAPGDLVLDPFAGSGTTCVVAKELGRRYLGIERDPVYYRLCLRRLSDLQLAEATA